MYRYSTPVELLSKWYLWNPHNSEITLRLLDNNNCYNLYRDETSNVHVTEEIFTLLTINNYNVVETGGVIDFTLILGNHVDSYLYGLLPSPMIIRKTIVISTT